MTTSNCRVCKYRGGWAGIGDGHCFLFKEEPMGRCAKWSGVGFEESGEILKEQWDGLSKYPRPTIKESLTVHADAEDYLRHRYGAFREHHFADEVRRAYSQGRYDEQQMQGPIPWPDNKPACAHEWVNREKNQPWLICKKCSANYKDTPK